MKNEKYSPMMNQYLEIKKNYKDTLILFRLGDFYELFFDDAKIASKELELVLTGKNAGVEERVPMCGVPFHAVTSYVDKLIKRGYRVGIVEQLEDPALAKGIVKRDVVQIITPGMLMDVGLKENENNYIVALKDLGFDYNIAYCDISTGELGILTIERKEAELIKELSILGTHEVVVPSSFDVAPFEDTFQREKIIVSRYTQTNQTNEYDYLLKGVLDPSQKETLIYLIEYLVTSQKRKLDYLKEAKVINAQTYMNMGPYTSKHLELTRTIHSDDRYGSLLWVLDKTKTAMGSRLLKSFILRPLARKEDILERQNLVETFVNEFMKREQLVKDLNEVYDLPRLIAKISYGNTNGRDLLQLAKSLSAIPSIKNQLIGNDNLNILNNNLDPLPEIVELINHAIVDEPPLSVKEGGLIKQGYNSDLDEIRKLSKGGKEWIANFEASEKERTGIKNLKVGFNKVFGFYIDISNSQLNLVKPEFGYIRKQTLTGSERFITQELKEKEDQVLNAEEKMIRLEYEIFVSIRDEIKKFTSIIQKNADTLAYIDLLCSLASVSVNNNYVKPTFVDTRDVSVLQARHPVLEQILKKHDYVPNDIHLDDEHFLQIITGPNMGGKSTYMKMVALLVIMAQIGCYIPVANATLPLFDAIYTRIGAADDLVSGRSTFMMEMEEVNEALVNATSQSLVLYDEIGRGTSTFDGVALAQAIIEYIAINLKCTTLFSTHYHELVSLASNLKGIVNVSAQVSEENNKVTFLYQIKEGSSERSYGINVASLAHLPQSVIERARVILDGLEQKSITQSGVQYVIKEVYKESEIEKKLENMDLSNLTPIEALNLLYEIKKVNKK